MIRIVQKIYAGGSAEETVNLALRARSSTDLNRICKENHLSVNRSKAILADHQCQWVVTKGLLRSFDRLTDLQRNHRIQGGQRRNSFSPTYPATVIVSDVKLILEQFHHKLLQQCIAVKLKKPTGNVKKIDIVSRIVAKIEITGPAEVTAISLLQTLDITILKQFCEKNDLSIYGTNV